MIDSRIETTKHIKNVIKFIKQFCSKLKIAGISHDYTKLNGFEKEYFDNYTEQLKDLTYGSDEYKECLNKLKPALDHHYSHNSHHPEYYENGIDDFDLLDLVEMLADWYAASLRHNDGDINKSIEINAKRFNISDQLKHIFQNTIDRHIFDKDSVLPKYKERFEVE